MSRHKLLISSFSLLLLLTPLWANAKDVTLPKDVSHKDIGQKKEELKKVEQQIQSRRAQDTALQEKQKATAAYLQEIQEQLVTATKALQEKETEAEDLSDELNDLAAETKAKTAALKNTRKRMTLLTEVLLHFSRIPPEAVMLQTVSPEDQIHRTLLLRSLLPRIQSSAFETAQDLKDLNQLQLKTTTQQRLVSVARQNLAWQRSNLDKLMKTRQGLLQKTVAERQALSDQMAALTAEAQDLRELMLKLSQQKLVLPKNLNKATPLTLKEGLRLPVAGKVLRAFGTKDNYGLQSQGLTLIGGAGSSIVAPAAGRVVFAGAFRGYGQIVILAHNGGYHSFLSGFGRIDAEMNQDVAAGEPLGTLPESVPKPELYFEWRYHNEPQNPSG